MKRLFKAPVGSTFRIQAVSLDAEIEGAFARLERREDEVPEPLYADDGNEILTVVEGFLGLS